MITIHILAVLVATVGLSIDVERLAREPQSNDEVTINLFYPVAGNEPPGAKAELWLGKRLVLTRTDFSNPLDRDTATQKPVRATVSRGGEPFELALSLGDSRLIECSGSLVPSPKMTDYVINISRTSSGTACQIRPITRQ